MRVYGSVSEVRLVRVARVSGRSHPDRMAAAFRDNRSVLRLSDPQLGVTAGC